MHGLMGWASGGSEWEGEKKKRTKRKGPAASLRIGHALLLPVGKLSMQDRSPGNLNDHNNADLWISRCPGCLVIQVIGHTHPGW